MHLSVKKLTAMHKRENNDFKKLYKCSRLINWLDIKLDSRDKYKSNKNKTRKLTKKRLTIFIITNKIIKQNGN